MIYRRLVHSHKVLFLLFSLNLLLKSQFYNNAFRSNMADTVTVYSAKTSTIWKFLMHLNDGKGIVYKWQEIKLDRLFLCEVNNFHSVVNNTIGGQIGIIDLSRLITAFLSDSKATV